MDAERDVRAAGPGAPATLAHGRELILLYDGVCALCNGIVTFILARDTRGRIGFASLQSALARDVLRRHGHDPDALDTVIVVESVPPDGERIHDRSSAVLRALGALGGIWGAIACALRLVPRPLRDWVYGLVARWRYRVFGKYDACPLPDARFADRFLDT